MKADIDDILIRCCLLGKQIAFGENVKDICDKYEEFLKTKVLPTEI